MKKVLSFVFMFVFTLQVTAMDVLALGKDEVVWDSNGKKTIFVSTEKLGNYVDGLQNKVDQCFERYDDLYVNNPWKGTLTMLLPSIIFPLLTYFVGSKLFKFYNRRTRTPQYVDNTIEQNGEHLANVVDDGISTLQSICLTIATGIASFYGILRSVATLPANMLTDCIQLRLRNEDINYQIFGALKEDIKKYGATIECSEGNTGLCYVDSQLWCFNPKSECYDSVIFAKDKLPPEERDEL